MISHEPILICSTHPEGRGVYVSEPSEKLGITCSGYILNHHGEKLWVQASTTSQTLNQGPFPMNLISFDVLASEPNLKVIVIKDFVSISDRDSATELACGLSDTTGQG